MTDLTRRGAIRRAGALAIVGALAGCGSPNSGSDERQGDDRPEYEDPGGPNAGDEEDHIVDEDAWEGVDEIRLEAHEEAWEGVEPEVIAGESNPTLVLEDGRNYAIAFENVDGEPHSLQLLDGSDDVLEETDRVEDEGGTATLEFDGRDEIERYVCGVHDSVMVGIVQSIGEGNLDADSEERTRENDDSDEGNESGGS